MVPMQGGFDAEDDGDGDGGGNYVNDNVEANSCSIDHMHARYDTLQYNALLICYFYFCLASRMVKMTNHGDEC